jgi:hypothetical protein
MDSSMSQNKPSQVGAFNPSVPLDWSELGTQVMQCAMTLASACDSSVSGLRDANGMREEPARPRSSPAGHRRGGGLS